MHRKSLAPLEVWWLVTATQDLGEAGFAGLVARPLPWWLPQPGHRCWRPGRLSTLGPQHCGHELENGLPEKEALPPVTQVSISVGKTGVVRDGPSRVLALPQELLLEVEPGSSHWRGCHALACGLVGTSVATPAGTIALGHRPHLHRRPLREAAP